MSDSGDVMYVSVTMMGEEKGVIGRDGEKEAKGKGEGEDQGQGNLWVGEKTKREHRKRRFDDK